MFRRRGHHQWSSVRGSLSEAVHRSRGGESVLATKAQLNDDLTRENLISVTVFGCCNCGSEFRARIFEPINHTNKKRTVPSFQFHSLDFRKLRTRDLIDGQTPTLEYSYKYGCKILLPTLHYASYSLICYIMSSFGQYFRVTTYGESHCRSVGCIVDGCPPGMQLDEEDIQQQVSRRRPGQSALSTPRNEMDQVHIQSGTENNLTLGTPIAILVNNKDQRPHDYGGSTIDLYPRPSHADWTYLQKYGIKASSGGGRSSARETIGKTTSVVCSKSL